MFGNKMIQSQIFCKAFATICLGTSQELASYSRNALILMTKTGPIPSPPISRLEPASTAREKGNCTMHSAATCSHQLAPAAALRTTSHRLLFSQIANSASQQIARSLSLATSWYLHDNVTRLTTLTFARAHAMRSKRTESTDSARTSTLPKMSSESLVSDGLIRRREVLQGLLAAAMPLGLLSCSTEKHGALVVGGLPVTCNLTLPVVCVSNANRNSAAAPGAPRFEYAYSKYSGWPEVKESLMTGRISAAYMLAPLVMDLADKKIPVKIVSLGHRSGAVIMVRTESPYQHFSQLRGKQIAIPSRFAVDFLFLRKMLAQEGMTPRDIQIVEMPPPDMPAALYANAVDAYCTGEPFGAAAQRAGYARPLRMTRDEWRNYICCVLTVREELINDNAPMVQDLVNQVLGAGVWLDTNKRIGTRRWRSPRAASISIRIPTFCGSSWRIPPTG